MDFIDQLKQFSERVKQLRDHLPTEEATKTALVMPFFQMMGYDVFNPMEFKPEFIADVGIKKGEKVDYAIYLNNSLCMLIEAKAANDQLLQHDGQLFRYFATTKAKFGILTNGILYKFYTDLEETNKMDSKPFLEFDLLDIKESMIPELKKFTKAAFDVVVIFNTASELKYSYEIKKYLDQQLKEPSDDFTIHIIKSFLETRMTQQVIEKFRPIVKKAINQYISELMNDKISNALKIEKQESAPPEKPETAEAAVEEDVNKVVTTEEETAALFIIKGILSELVSTKRIIAKDTVNYYGITLDGKSSKWICRLKLSDKRKCIVFPNSDKEEKIMLNEVEDIYQFKQRIIDSYHLLEPMK